MPRLLANLVSKMLANAEKLNICSWDWSDVVLGIGPQRAAMACTQERCHGLCWCGNGGQARLDLNMQATLAWNDDPTSTEGSIEVGHLKRSVLISALVSRETADP